MDVREERYFPPIAKYLLLIISIFLGILLSFPMVWGLEWLYGANLEETYQNLNRNSSVGERSFARLGVFIRHSMSFAIPALAVAVILYRRKWAHSLDIDKAPRIFNLMVGSITILMAFPLAHFALWLNKQIQLPAWAVSMEDSLQKAVDGLLIADSSWELLSNVIIIAVLPALGEEFIFRGIIQKGLNSIFRSPIWAIWVAAFLFSAFHMQLEGFLPRMLLGALLGYLYYWTGNLWIPIAAHFVNNGIQVVAQYFAPTELAEVSIENSNEISWGITIISLIFVLSLSFLMIRYNRNNQPD